MKTLNKNHCNSTKQQGATLISALTFLILMSVVSVSAMKVSIVDIQVAGNDQTKWKTYVGAATTLAKNVTLYNGLHLTGLNAQSDFNDHSKLKLETKITRDEKEQRVRCSGIQGNANSIGSGGIPNCKVFNFTAKGYKPGSQISDTHVMSVGKQVPNSHEL